MKKKTKRRGELIINVSCIEFIFRGLITLFLFFFSFQEAQISQAVVFSDARRSKKIFFFFIVLNKFHITSFLVFLALLYCVGSLINYH